MANNKQRIKWIDMAKGYGIILVIVGHCDIPLFTDYIYAFHIPLFFFLSGYVYTIKDSFVNFSYNKVRKMIIPYFCLCIPMIFFELYFGNKGVIDFDGIHTEAYNFIIQERHTTLWYLSTLILIVFILYPFLKYKFRFLSIIIIISSFCGLLLWRYKIKALPWNIDAVLVVLPFFYVGYFVKKHYGTLAFPQSYKKYSLLTSLFFLILSLAITYWNITLSGNRIDIYCSTFGIECISYISAFTGIFSCIFFSMFFTNSVISYIGRNSLLFFAWHQSIVMPSISYLYWKTGICSWHIYQETTIFKWITIVLTIIILSVLNELISRSRIKFALGK